MTEELLAASLSDTVTQQGQSQHDIAKVGKLFFFESCAFYSIECEWIRVNVQDDCHDGQENSHNKQENMEIFHVLGEIYTMIVSQASTSRNLSNWRELGFAIQKAKPAAFAELARAAQMYLQSASFLIVIDI